MWKRYLSGIIIIIAAGILSLPWWFSSQQAQWLSNQFLAPNYHLNFSQQWQVGSKGLQLSHLQIQTPKCTLVELQNIQLNWWNVRRLSVQNATLDYDCLSQIPSNDEKTALNLTALLSWIPAAEVEISQFHLKNTEAISTANLQPLLASDISASLYYDGNKIQFNAKAMSEQSAQSAVIFQHSSELTPQDQHFQWRGQTDYQPVQNQHYHLNFNTQLNNELVSLPTSGEFKLDWENPDFAVNKGNIGITWNGEKGQISAQDLQRNQALLDVPFSFIDNGLEITWGKLNWIFDGYQPMRGFLGIKLQKTRDAWLPLKADLNVILQTFGEFGKGEIVISGKDAEIGGGENQNELRLNLKTRGDLRYNNTVAQTNLTYHIGGHFNHPILMFREGSIFKMDNIQPDSKIHVRLPLDNVIIGKYGLEGRLQATLQGYTPQFEQLDLKLDGQAHQFIAGVKTIFELRDERHKLRQAETQALNRWDWDIQGSTRWKALQTKLNFAGVGFWEADHIELNRLTAHSDAVNLDGVKMGAIHLELKDQLYWDYEAEKIRGLLQANTDSVQFDYGGGFVQPILGVGIDGKSINDFNVSGELTAGKLGPLSIQAQYANQALTGKIWWKKQSAKVFQPLFSQKWDWQIHDGTIKGATNFTIDENGVVMRGELDLQNSEISLPDGEIQGLNIRFPLHYQGYSLQATNKNPIRVSAQKVRSGALEISDVTFNAYGHYPYSARHPLHFSALNMGLFDGNLSVPSFSLPQQKIAVLNLQQIDLNRVLSTAQYNQILMTGRINASFPFLLNNPDCLICDGQISQATKLNIRLNDEMVKGLKSGGWTESILVDVIKNMDLTACDAKVNLKPDGVMKLAATLVGYNPDKKTHNPITLNYTHQENMFELWRMIDYGSQFEQNLEYRLNQQSQQ